MLMSPRKPNGFPCDLNTKSRTRSVLLQNYCTTVRDDWDCRLRPVEPKVRPRQPKLKFSSTRPENHRTSTKNIKKIAVQLGIIIFFDKCVDIVTARHNLRTLRMNKSLFLSELGRVAKDGAPWPGIGMQDHGTGDQGRKATWPGIGLQEQNGESGHFKNGDLNQLTHLSHAAN